MKTTSPCLKASDIEALLAESVAPSQSQLWELHFSDCESCRLAMANRVGDQQWWQEAEKSLKSESTPMVRAAVEIAAEEHESIEELVKLLGPTDDPQMLGRIGSYEILGVLGRGGMGVVFKAFDAPLNRFVAIKMLLPHLAASGAARKRFAREGQAVAAVVDDHVMAIHCVDEWQGVPYLVTTYSRGVSLQKRLSDNGPMEVREILRIGLQAAKGLAAAHAQGIIHRDIKPANIFLDQNVERVQLMDFGLARAVDDASLTSTGVLAGTPQYMSPEQARAEAVDHRSDLFSLGSVMYAMCTGHSPFRAESSYGVLRLITDTEPRPIREVNPDIPEWLCVLISRLMLKSRDERLENALEVAALLEQCLAHVQQPCNVKLPSSLDSTHPVASVGFLTSLVGVSKMVSSKVVLIALLVVGMAAAMIQVRTGSPNTDEALAALQGEWQLVSSMKDGKSVPSDELYNERLIIDGTQFARWQTKPNGEELQGESGRLSVSADGKNNSIDLHLTIGTAYGIYKLEGDKLDLCVSREGRPRPDTLSAGPNSTRILQSFNRKVRTASGSQAKTSKVDFTDDWLKKIPAECPKQATEAKEWMIENQFEEIRTGDLTAEVMKDINPDMQLSALEQLGAKSFLFGILKSKSQVAMVPFIEVYCFVNELDVVVGMQVSPKNGVRSRPAPTPANVVEQ